MYRSKYKHQIAYSTDRKTIELVKTLNSEKKTETVLKHEELVPEFVAWVLIHYMKGNGLKKIDTKFGVLELKEVDTNE
jgi:tRNA splicing ligase